MTTATVTETIELTFDLPHPVETVWRALTEPELLGKWLMATDLQPRVGASFTFTAEPTPWWDGIVNGEVLDVEPHRRLTYTWRGGPLDTVVTWTLTPTDTGTRLALEHAGFPPDQKHAVEGARQGWQRMAGDALPRLLAE